jgi:hypothetical protein
VTDLDLRRGPKGLAAVGVAAGLLRSEPQAYFRERECGHLARPLPLLPDGIGTM